MNYSKFVMLHALLLLQMAFTKPNIVLVFIDDMGWTDVEYIEERYYTPSFYETPHLNQMVKEGMEFTNAYANAPNCAPSRAALLSGQYAPRTGVYTVGSSSRGNSKDRKLIPTKNKEELRPDIITIAEALKNDGYATISLGKWHMGEGPETGPLGQGFDVNIGGYSTGSPPKDSTGNPPRGYFCPWDSRAVGLEDCQEGEYLPDRLMDEAISFITENKDNPFFVYLSHYAVHTRLDAKDSMIDYFKTKTPSGKHNNPTYAAMIKSVDDNLGRLLDTLKALELESNTVVAFFSDNGGPKGHTINTPLRAAKGSLYEGGIREPLVFKWPGVIAPGSVCDVPVIGVDFYPTFLEMAGAPVPDGKILDGVSLLPLLKQTGDLQREAIFWHAPVYLQGNTKISCLI